MCSRVPASFERSSVRALMLALGGRGGKSLRLRISPNEVSLSPRAAGERLHLGPAGKKSRHAVVPPNQPATWRMVSLLWHCAAAPLPSDLRRNCKKRASAMCETSQALSFCIACVTLVYGPIFLSWAFHLKGHGPFKDQVALLPQEPEDSKLSPCMQFLFHLCFSVLTVVFHLSDTRFVPRGGGGGFVFTASGGWRVSSFSFSTIPMPIRTI